MTRHLWNIAFIAMLTVGHAAGATSFLEFDDGLLPSAHGWTFNNGAVEPNFYSVSNGVLTGDTLTPPGESFGQWYSISGAYDSSLDMVFEVRARVIGAQSAIASAFGVYTAQVYAEVGVGNDFVQVVHAPEPDVNTFVPTPTRDTFHTYRMTSAGGTNAIEVRVDGVLVYQGLMRANTLSIPNSIGFGDLTNSGDAHWEIDSVYYQNDPVPEPGTLACCALGACLLVFCQTRRT